MLQTNSIRIYCCWHEFKQPTGSVLFLTAYREWVILKRHILEKERRITWSVIQTKCMLNSKTSQTLEVLVPWVCGQLQYAVQTNTHSCIMWCDSAAAAAVGLICLTNKHNVKAHVFSVRGSLCVFKEKYAAVTRCVCFHLNQQQQADCV